MKVTEQSPYEIAVGRSIVLGNDVHALNGLADAAFGETRGQPAGDNRLQQFNTATLAVQILNFFRHHSMGRTG